MDKVGISVTGTLLTGLKNEDTGPGSFAALKALFENRVRKAAAEITGSKTAGKAVAVKFCLLLWKERNNDHVFTPFEYIHHLFLEALVDLVVSCKEQRIKQMYRMYVAKPEDMLKIVHAITEE